MAEPELVMPPPGTLCVTWTLDAVRSDGLPHGRRLVLPGAPAAVAAFARSQWLCFLELHIVINSPGVSFHDRPP